MGGKRKRKKLRSVFASWLWRAAEEMGVHGTRFMIAALRTASPTSMMMAR
jgi:hypothetical protein